MLKHTSKNAIASCVFSYGGNYCDNHMKMAIVLIRNLREAGYEEDIIIITNDDRYADEISNENVTIERREIIDYKALYQWKCKAWGLSIFDAQKLYYWGIDGYDKLLCLDNDILAGSDDDHSSKFLDWHLPTPQVSCAVCASESTGIGQYVVNSGIMLIKPSQAMFNDMYNIMVNADFDSIRGWNNYGKMTSGIGEITHWDFQASNAIQGFIPYYFKDKLNPFDWRKYFRHYAGVSKYYDEVYVETCKRYGCKLIYD